MIGWGKRETPKPPSLPHAAVDDAPPGEAAKVAHVQRLCAMGGIIGESLKPDGEKFKTFDGMPDELEYERNQYNKYRASALRIADTITDEFFRSAAIHFIIDASMKAGDDDDARTLLKHVEVDFIREKIEAAYPQLTRPKLSGLIQRA